MEAQLKAPLAVAVVLAVVLNVLAIWIGIRIAVSIKDAATTMSEVEQLRREVDALKKEQAR